MALVILGHPYYQNSLANKTIVEELQNSNADIEIRDLFGLYPDYKIDIEAEQTALLRHQNIIFQFPAFWYNVPAILKLWFDEVLQYGFSHGSTGGRLKGKNFLVSCTTGASQSDYHPLGNQHFRISEFWKNLEQTAYLCQMNFIEPFFLLGASKHSKQNEEALREKAREQAQSILNRIKQL